MKRVTKGGKKTQQAAGYTINLFSHAWTDRKNGKKKEDSC
jgi:hypothetical protein